MMEAAPLPPESATTNRAATAPRWNYPATAMPPPQAIRRTDPQKPRGDRANGRKTYFKIKALFTHFFVFFTRFYSFLNYSKFL
jgi:hypothetical protein